MVTDGFTVVEPVADVEVKPPGAMAMLVAPVVTQVSVTAEPDSTLLGLAVNELMDGLVAAE